MNSPSDAIQADGEPLHTTCHATVRTIRANFNQALRDRDRRATADEHIGQAIRRLTQPGAKRKTIRIDELRDIVDDADRAAPTTDTRDLTIAALRDQVAALQAETIRLEHLLDSLRRLPADAPGRATGGPQGHGTDQPGPECQPGQ